ncbi:MAG TPA: cellulase family glycosylhydrolase [Gaiellaceae bacterium]|nr:cellulase family glycosylhydrolase [Gaiellaceae bacterium]
MGVVTRYLVTAGAILCLGAATASAGLAGRVVTKYSTPGTAPLVTGLADPSLFTGAQRVSAFALSRSAGASYARIGVAWRSIAPAHRPSGFDARDPASPGYSWAGLDATIEAAAAAHVTPILDVNSTPQWAFAKRPTSGGAGTPKAAALGDFAYALATHYDGSNGLPAEHVFQVWNEPNLSLDLGPVSATAYRGMVNAFAQAVHEVDPANLVVAGALDPFGHPKGKKQKWYSVSPLTFMRSLLCLSQGPHPHSTCHSAVHFDIWSHHPYTFGGPFGHAKNPNDVELGDLPRMRSVLQAGVRLHHVVASHPVRFWVTEFGWDSSPPRPHAAPMGLAARWTAESLHQMWLSGVSLVTWFDLQDRRSPSPYQSGLYFHSASLENARPKPVLTAFRFPFVAYLGRSSVSIWGRDATSSKARVTIQLRHGRSGRWRTVAQVGANSHGIFRAKAKLRATKSDWVRAVAPGSGRSLAFSLTVPRAPRIGPWGN